MKKQQIWLQTNLGYHATKNQILQSRMITGDGQDYKGRLTFRLKDFKDITVQITTKGKLSITYPEGISYKNILEHLKPLLVKGDGSPAEIISVIKRPKGEEEGIRLVFSPPNGEIRWQGGYGLINIEVTLHNVSPNKTFRNVTGYFVMQKDIYVSSDIQPLNRGIPFLYFHFGKNVLHKKSGAMLSRLTLRVPRKKGDYHLGADLMAEELEDWKWFAYLLKVENNRFRIDRVK